jgi:hypothetical protein
VLADIASEENGNRRNANLSRELLFKYLSLERYYRVGFLGLLGLLPEKCVIIDVFGVGVLSPRQRIPEIPPGIG